MDIPKMMSIRQVAQTRILPEHALRLLVKQNKIPHVMVGKKALINYGALVNQLHNMSSLDTSKHE